MLYSYNVTICLYADVAELVDALDLGSSGIFCECSSHFIRTSAPCSGGRFLLAPAFSKHLAVKTGIFLNTVFHNPVENPLESRGMLRYKAMVNGIFLGESLRTSQHSFPQPGGKLR